MNEQFDERQPGCGVDEIQVAVSGRSSRVCASLGGIHVQRMMTCSTWNVCLHCFVPLTFTINQNMEKKVRVSMGRLCVRFQCISWECDVETWIYVFIQHDAFDLGPQHLTPACNVQLEY